MGKELSVITPLHKSTQRDYLARMNDSKVECMKVARRYDYEFWDGDRRFGYGGYKYDGRQRAIAEQLVKVYSLKDDAKILDIGCGKGFLLYEFKRLLPKCSVIGIDISGYAIKNAKPEVKPYLSIHDASTTLPFATKEFDLVTSITTLHNLPVNRLKPALKEMERVGKRGYLAVESYRNEQELFNLQCWALTAESFFSNLEWITLFKEFGYTGNYEFIHFE